MMLPFKMLQLKSRTLAMDAAFQELLDQWEPPVVQELQDVQEPQEHQEIQESHHNHHVSH